MSHLKSGDRLTKKFLTGVASRAEDSANRSKLGGVRLTPPPVPAAEPHFLVRGWFNTSSLVFRPQITYGCISYFSSTGKNVIKEIGWDEKRDIPGVFGYGDDKKEDLGADGLEYQYTFTNTAPDVQTTSASKLRLALGGLEDINSAVIYVCLVVKYDYFFVGDEADTMHPIQCVNDTSFEVASAYAEFINSMSDYNESVSPGQTRGRYGIYRMATLTLPESGDDDYFKDSDGFVRMRCTQEIGCGDIRI